MAVLMSDVTLATHSMKSGNTTESGLSPLIMVGVMFVILVTIIIAQRNHESL